MTENERKMTLQELVASLPGDDLSVLIQERVTQVNEGFTEMATEIKNLRAENQEMKECKEKVAKTLSEKELELTGAKSLAANREQALQGATEDYTELRKATEEKLASFKNIVNELESRPKEKEQIRLTFVVLWVHEGNLMTRASQNETEAKSFYNLLGDDTQKSLCWSHVWNSENLNDEAMRCFIEELEHDVRLSMKALGISASSNEVLIPDEVADLLQLAREELLKGGSDSVVLHRIESMLSDVEDDDEFEPAIVEVVAE